MRGPSTVPAPSLRSSAPAPPPITTIPTAPEPAPLGEADLDAIGEKFVSLTARVVPYGQAEQVGLYVEEMSFGVFAESIATNPRVPLLWGHDRDQLPIGVASPSGWREAADGLYGKFTLSGTAWAQVIASEVRNLPGAFGVSVSFIPEVSAWSFASTWDPDTDNLDRVVRQRARLLEVSVTPTPAYRGAVITEVEAVKLNDNARTYVLNARHRHQSRILLRDHDERLAAKIAARAELDKWKRWLDSVRRP